MCGDGVAVLACLDLGMLTPKCSRLHRVSPYLVFALLPAPYSSSASRRLRLTVVAAAAAYLLLAFVGVDTTGGKSLGPRLLLPLLPLLAVAAVGSIVSYLRAETRVERLAGRLGVALVAIAVTIHLGGTVRPTTAQRTMRQRGAVLMPLTVSRPMILHGALLFPCNSRTSFFYGLA